MKNNKYHTVGLIDDHVLLRNALGSLIQSFDNYKVILEASDGNELMGMLSKKSLPDILVTDISMPGMDGFEICTRVTALYPSIKILALSMHNEEDIIIRMIQAGAKGYLLKSASISEIKQAFQNLLKDEYYFTPEINRKIAVGIQKGNEADTPELNSREIEFLKLICSELSHKEISLKMKISKRTVDYYRDALFRKLNTRSRVGLVKYAILHNYV
jgi:two-component system, NarL family, invasion response regulator UvrY